jgi:hypothetical protein
MRLAESSRVQCGGSSESYVSLGGIGVVGVRLRPTDRADVGSERHSSPDRSELHRELDRNLCHRQMLTEPGRRPGRRLRHAGHFVAISSCAYAEQSGSGDRITHAGGSTVPQRCTEDRLAGHGGGEYIRECGSLHSTSPVRPEYVRYGPRRRDPTVLDIVDPVWKGHHQRQNQHGYADTIEDTEQKGLVTMSVIRQYQHFRADNSSLQETSSSATAPILFALTAAAAAPREYSERPRRRPGESRSPAARQRSQPRRSI